jgi:hypothetical protein
MISPSRNAKPMLKNIKNDKTRMNIMLLDIKVEMSSDNLSMVSIELTHSSFSHNLLFFPTMILFALNCFP